MNQMGPMQPMPVGANHPHARRKPSMSNMNYAMVALLFSITILLVATLSFIMFGRGKKLYSEEKMQAVFLNGGQIYFGNISELNGSYMRLSNIYYLRVEQQVQPVQGQDQQAQQSISLAKLGCELHGPEDSMIINRDQILFWEDLKNNGDDQDGQVVKAVRDFVEKNPDGQKCTTGSNSATPTPTPSAAAATPTPSGAVKKP